VSNILGKLGVASRTEAAAVALRDGAARSAGRPRPATLARILGTGVKSSCDLPGCTSAWRRASPQAWAAWLLTSS
jgi:hypothetical protein